MARERAALRHRTPLILRRELADRRRSTLGWSLGLAALTAVEVALFPTVRDQPSMGDVWENAPDTMKALFGFGGSLDLASGAGYLRVELFAFTLPLLFLIFAIGAGAGVIAGDDERGSLGLVLAHPVHRRRLVLERFAAVAVIGSVLAGVALAITLAGGAVAGLGVGARELVAATSATLALALLYGAVALFVGCATGRRGLAISVAAAAAVAGYLIDSLASVTDVLDVLRPLSPFHWANPSQLVVGAGAAGIAVTIMATAALIAVSTAVFERRDIGRS